MNSHCNEMKRKSLFWRRLTSTVIDLSLIYSISILLQMVIWNFTFVSFSNIFITSFLLYYFISYWLLKGSTLAKQLTGIKIVREKRNAIPAKDIFFREIILKGLVGLLIPAFLIERLFPKYSALFTVIIFVVILLLSLVILFAFKRTWWELISKTQTIKTNFPLKKGLAYSFISVTALIAGAILFIIYPFSSGKEKLQTSFTPAYPITEETKHYADFVKTNSQNPVDYIFDLFKKCDIVVISERLHPEYTQYDLIFKIVHDERFINNVGNIFTECGSVSFQDTLNSYLNSHFENEEQLNRNTANLQRNSNGIWPLWDNTNLFDFFKTVNKLNNTLPDSSKINWYFTDLAVNWETMTHEKFIKGYTNPKRDSIMAANIIEKYKNVIAKQRRKKALVIMNSRHGYGLINNKFNDAIKIEYNGTTAFLMRAFSGKAANVMLNTISIKYGYMFTPLQNGKWETAFSLCGNPDVGFNFAGSPFGNDKFDAAFFNTPSLTYKDIFTGFIFYKPLTEHIKKNGFPYEFENFEDSILRREAYVNNSQVETFKRIIAFNKQNPKEPVLTEATNYALLYNLIDVAFVPFLLIISYLIGLIFFIKQVRKNNYATKGTLHDCGNRML